MTPEEILKGLYDETLVGNGPAVLDLTHRALGMGMEPGTMLFEALIPALEEVGARFERGDFFVPEMLVAGKAMAGSMEVLRPLLADTGVETIGKFLMGTVKGDVHDIGKNLVNIMLEGAGFEVIDLGVQVAPERFVSAIEEHAPDVVGFSAFLTTTMPMFKANINALEKAGLRERVIVMVGGAPVTQEYADAVGADGYAADASATVKRAKALLQDRRAGVSRMTGSRYDGPVRETVLRSTGKEVVIATNRPFCIIGERINPTGRKLFQEQLRAGDLSLVEKDVHAQVAGGANVLDVNMGVPLTDEPELLVKAIQLVQSLTDLPICIDSSVVEALEAGLAVYQGRALVNSVTAEDERLEAILPLVKKHDAAIIALPNDHDEIPMEADKRIELVGKIVEVATTEYGIAIDDIVIDPLAMPIGADSGVGRTALETVRRIHDTWGLNMTCGASNVSFGMPGRHAINAAWLPLAMANGMTSAIMDSRTTAIVDSVRAADLLLGNDEWGMSWIGTHRARVAAEKAAQEAAQEAAQGSHSVSEDRPSIEALRREGLISPPTTADTREEGASRVVLRFSPSGQEVRVPGGVSLFDAASWNGIAIDSTCGGHGTCRRCKVQLTSGSAPITRHDVRTFTESELDDGWRLACLVTTTHDLAVEVPPLVTRPKAATVGVGRQVILRPAVQKRYVELDEPTLADQRTDLQRVTDAIDDLELRPDLHALTRLPTVLREADFKVTAVIVDEVLIDIEPGDTTERRHGIAFDLGTTTVVATLLDLGTGTPVAVASMLNKQQPFGADVITRISATMMDPAALQRLQVLAQATLAELAHEVCAEGGVAVTEVHEVAVAGNATMTALLLGINPEPLGVAPFIQAAATWPHLRASDVGVMAHPGARAYLFPSLGAYVGGDIVAGMLASGLDRDKRVRLFIDVGTNCEIALTDGQRIVSTAAPAGPAFEGGAIRCGMRAADGAIETITLRPQPGEGEEPVSLGVIGDSEARGLCGSGLVDAVAELAKVGLLDQSGRFVTQELADERVPALADRLAAIGEERIFILHRPAPETEPAQCVYLSQRDVRELQFAKAAISTGWTLMLEELGVEQSDVQQVLLAGSFGSRISPASAVRIGLVPKVPVLRIVSAGNVAGEGAKMALLSLRERAGAEALLDEVAYVELSDRPDFNDRFVEQLLLPAVTPGDGAGRVALVACGAIAQPAAEVAARHTLPVDVHPLPPLLHNQPHRIPGEVERMAAELSDRYDRVVVGYADCGTYGALDAVCARLGLERLPGLHCYDLYAGPPVVEDLLESEPGTYVLTDYLVKSFSRSVIRELGLDRHPELRDDYFRHYTRLVWLVQTEDPLEQAELRTLAQAAAERIGLPLQVVRTGLSGLERALLDLVG